MSGYKKNSMTYQQGTLGVCYRLICTNFGDGFLCTLSPNHNIHRENGVYHWWTTYTLKSRSVSEIHFPAFWRYKFTDFKNSKKNSIFGKKTAVGKNAWIKACIKMILLFFRFKLKMVVHAAYTREKTCEINNFWYFLKKS